MIPAVVIFDLDKTLAASKQPITPAMAEALTQLLTRTNVAIITGGKFEQLTGQAADLLPEDATRERLYLLPTSGAALYEYHEGTRQVSPKKKYRKSKRLWKKPLLRLMSSIRASPHTDRASRTAARRSLSRRSDSRLPSGRKRLGIRSARSASSCVMRSPLTFLIIQSKPAVQALST